MKVIVLLFSIVSVVLCVTVIEDKAENVNGGGEIISEKVITETKSVSSGGSAAVGHVDKKFEDEEILDEVYSKGKDKVMDGHILMGEKLVADSHVHGGQILEAGLVKGLSAGGTLKKEELKNEEALKVGSSVTVGQLSAASHAMVGSKKEIVAEELGHHMIGNEHLKEHAGIALDKELHHQIAGSYKIAGDHLLENHHVGNMKHNPIHLHDAEIIADQNKHIEQVSEIETTKIIHEKQVTNHQISTHMGHGHVNPVGAHHPIVTSAEIINPHAQKFMHHKVIDHMIARPVVHKLPMHPPIVMQTPHEETIHQLSAIRLINQQLQEAMIQNQQAALVGLEIQRQLEMKDKRQKLMASHHIPRIVHVHEHVPISGHVLPMVKPSDHLVKHEGHHHVAVLGDIHHTSVNKHELSKMRHLANEMHSPLVVHPKVVHNAGAVQKATMAAGVAKESSVGTGIIEEVVINEGIAKKHAVGAGIEVGKGTHEELIGIYAPENGKEIASDVLALKPVVPKTAKETDKNILGIDMLADESVKKMDTVKKTEDTIAASAVIKGLDSLADKTLKEMDSLKNIEGLVIKKADTLEEKSVEDLGELKKKEELASGGSLLKSANVAMDQAIKATETIKKTEGEIAEAGVMNAADMTVDKTLKDVVKKTAVAEEAISKSSKGTEALRNTENARVGDAALKEALAADKSLKEVDAAKKTENAIAGSASIKEANNLADKAIKDLSAIEKTENVAATSMGAVIAVANAVKEMDSVEKTNSAPAEDTILKAVVADKSVKEAAIKNIEDAAVQDAVLKSANTIADSAVKLAKTGINTEGALAFDAALKATNTVAENKMAESAVAGSAISKETDIAVEKTMKEANVKKAEDSAVQGATFIVDNAVKLSDAVKKAESSGTKIVADNAIKATDTVKKPVSADAGNAAIKAANIATDEVVKVADAVKNTESAVAQDTELKAANIVADGAIKVADTVKKPVSADAGNAAIKAPEIATDDVVKVADAVKDTESAVVQGTALKAANIVPDSAIKVADTVKEPESVDAGNAALKAANIATDEVVKVADAVKNTESAVAQGTKLKAANIVADSVTKVTNAASKMDGAVAGDVVTKELGLSVSDKAVKVADSKKAEDSVAPDSVFSGNSMKLADSRKNAEDLTKKTEEAISSKTDNSVKEVDAVKKSTNAKVDLTIVNDAKLGALGNSVALKKAGTVQQSLKDAALDKIESMLVQAVANDAVKKVADKDTAVTSGEKANINVVKDNKNVQAIETANFAPGIDNALVKQENEKVIADKSLQKEAVEKKTDDIAQDSKPTEQLKVDEALQNPADKVVAIDESVSGKDPIEEDIDERFKDVKEPEEIGVNVKNAKKTEAEKKIDILRKNMVGERMGSVVATGGDTSKNDPIFTLEEGSTQKMTQDQDKIEQR